MSQIMQTFNIQTVTPLGHILKTGSFGKQTPTVIFQEKTAQLVHLSPFKGQAEALDQALRERFGLGLTATGKWTSTGEGETRIRVMWSGLNQWLLQTAHGNSRSLYEECLESCEGFSSVVDQGHSRCILQLSGSNAAEVLKRHCGLDLYEPNFAVGDCAALQLAHLSANLLRLENNAAGESVYEAQVFRSFAESLWHELSHAAGQFGYQVI